MKTGLRGLVLLFTLALAGIAGAASGSLDPNFGTRGVATFAELGPGGPSAMVVQPDGKVVMASADWRRPTVVRLDTAGTIDSRFGVSGVATLTLAANEVHVTQLALQSDGRILVAGSTRIDRDARVFVMRLNVDGTIDTTFGDAGTIEAAVLPTPAQDGNISYIHFVSFVGMAVSAADDIVVAGTATSSDGSGALFLIRYRPDGSLDALFGDMGMMIEPASDAATMAVSANPVLQGDQGVLLFGSKRFEGFAYVAVRYDSAGRFDPSFGSAGIARLPVGVTQALLQQDGRIVLAGGQAGDPPTLRVARLEPTGATDRSFGDKGVVAVPVGECGILLTARIDPCLRESTAIVLQPDGKVVQIGTGSFGTGHETAIARYDRQGAPDPGFGTRGLVRTPYDASSGLGAADAEGRWLYVAGATFLGGYTRIARYLLDATPGSIELDTDANPTLPGQAITLTATITGQAPDGRVSFFDDETAITGCTEAALVVVGPTQARATCTTPLATGSHLLTAAYHGNPTNSPSVSALLVQTIGPVPGTLVREYVETELGDYFMTSNPAEMAGLGDGTNGWQPTGRSFHMFAEGTPRTREMCRYFSMAAFAPKSSHFFGTGRAGCTLYSPWQLEGLVVRSMLPDTTGACPKGTRPLFRMFNAGQGGVPHHRYSIDTDVRTAMLAQGWVPEGAGMGVVGCVLP